MESLSHWRMPICSLDKRAPEKIKMRAMKDEINFM